MKTPSKGVHFACACVTSLFCAGVVAQPTDENSLPRQLAPYLYRMRSDHDLPRALIVPHGQPPTYSLDNLAEWSCREAGNPGSLKNCARNFLSRKPFTLKRVILLERAADIYGHSRYEIENTDGQIMDVWATEYGCNFSPDGSKLREGVIESNLEDLRSPWGPEPYNNIEYNHLLQVGTLPYLQRVMPNGQVLWAYVYLVQTTGHTQDKWENPVVEDPLLGFGEVVCPKGSGATGFLTSNMTRQGTFTFGALAMEIDTFTGQLKEKHPRIRAVPTAEVEAHYRRALDELIAEGVITEKDTQFTDERFGSTRPPSRFLNKVSEFAERLQSNLLKTYFSDITPGAKK